MRLLCLAVALAAAAPMPVLAQDPEVVEVLDSPPPPSRTRILRYVPPRLIRCPQAIYPDSLKRKGIGGHVVLEVVVDTTGRVRPEGIRVRSNPNRALVEAVRAKALLCRFEPARVGRTAVKKTVLIREDFYPRGRR